jgi:hypothetical protein
MDPTTNDVREQNAAPISPRPLNQPIARGKRLEHERTVTEN